MYKEGLVNFREMTIDDILFVNSLRNVYAEEFLHDYKTYTIEETKEWFLNNTIPYIIIEMDNSPIGYVRLSNLTESDIYIGADILPEYTNKGIGYKVYKKVLPIIFDKYKLNTISLEVLSTNKRGLYLYEKVGFKKIYSTTINRNGEEVESIKMRILKNEI